MAIRVQTRNIQQQSAPAEAFGYNPNVSAAGAEAVARNLQGIGREVLQTKRFLDTEKRREVAEQKAFEAEDRRKKAEMETLRNKLQRKKDAADKIVSDKLYTEMQVGLLQAEANFTEALASGNDEAVKEAEANFNKFDQEDPSFSFGDTSRLNNPDYMTQAGYGNDLKVRFTRAKLKADAQKQTYTIVNQLDEDEKTASTTYWTNHSTYSKQPMPAMAFDSTLSAAVKLGSSDNLDQLSSAESAQTYRSRASGLVRDLFIREANMADTTDKVREYQERFQQLLRTDSVSFMGKRDRDGTIKHFDERIAEIIQSGHDQAKDRITNSIVANNHSIANLITSAGNGPVDQNVIQQLAPESASLLVESVDPDTEITRANQEKAQFGLAASYLLTQDGLGISPLLIDSLELVEGFETGQRADSFEFPVITVDGQSIDLNKLPTELTNKLRKKVIDTANYIQEVAIEGDDTYTVAQTILGDKFNDPVAQADFLRMIGREGEPLLNIPEQSDFNVRDVEGTVVYFKTLVADNPILPVTKHLVTKLQDAKTADQATEAFLGLALVNTGFDFRSMDPKTRQQTIAEVLKPFIEDTSLSGAFDDDNPVHSSLYEYIRDTMGSVLFDQKSYYTSKNLVGHANALDSLIKGSIVRMSNTAGPDGLRDRLPDMVGPDGKIKSHKLRDLISFGGGRTFDLRKMIGGTERRYLDAFGGIKEATDYANVRVAISPRINKMFYNYDLGRRQASRKKGAAKREPVTAQFSEIFGRDPRFNQETLAQNIAVEGFKKIVENRENFDFERSIITQMKLLGVDIKLLNNLEAEDISDVDLEAILSEAHVRDRNGLLKSFFDFSTQTVTRDGKAGILIKTFDRNTRSYIPLRDKNGDTVVLTDDEVVDKFSDKSAEDFYTLGQVLQGELTTVGGFVTSPLLLPYVDQFNR